MVCFILLGILLRIVVPSRIPKREKFNSDRSNKETSMTYQIAQDNGQTGHSEAVHAEINLGLKKGYEGFAQEKGEVLGFLTDLYLDAAQNSRPFVPFVVTDSVITYAYFSNKQWGGDDKWHAAHEPALVLASDKSPLYAADVSDDEWKELVESYAHKLGEKFQQFRVYVTYSRTEVKIFQRQS